MSFLNEWDECLLRQYITIMSLGQHHDNKGAFLYQQGFAYTLM